MHRVLCLVLALAAAPAAGSVTRITAPEGGPAPVRVLAAGEAARLHALRLGGGAPRPLDGSQGHAMWDALGSGCVDGGGPDDPFPTGKGEARAPAFCLAQPCARQLSRDELAFEVLGRPLRTGEWDLYVSRYAQACASEVQLPPASEPPLMLVDIPSLEWSDPLGRGTPRQVTTGLSTGIGRSDTPITTGLSTGSTGFPGAGPARPFTPEGGGFPPLIVIASSEAASGSPELPETPQPVPLPGALAMILSGLALLGGLRRAR